MTYIAVIKLRDNSALYFGPFSSYDDADNFAQKKLKEYAQGRCAYIDSIREPVLYPFRRT